MCICACLVYINYHMATWVSAFLAHFSTAPHTVLYIFPPFHKTITTWMCGLVPFLLLLGTNSFCFSTAPFSINSLWWHSVTGVPWRQEGINHATTCYKHVSRQAQGGVRRSRATAEVWVEVVSATLLKGETSKMKTQLLSPKSNHIWQSKMDCQLGVLKLWSSHHRSIKVKKSRQGGMCCPTNRRCNMSLSAAAAAAAIVTSCLRGSKWRGEAGGQASQRYGAGYRHVCSCCLARKMKKDKKKEC